jgi:8-oxo-dGTP pyrophosphatase MutT (NUDIX family)
MLIDDRPDLEVFMMERNANTIFAGGMWVFPGGAVDPTDDPGVFEYRRNKRPFASNLLEECLLWRVSFG